MGHVKINSLKIEEPNWTGQYIENIPIQIEAIANDDYVFEKWKSHGLLDQKKLTISTKKIKKIIPIFKKIE